MKGKILGLVLLALVIACVWFVKPKKDFFATP